MGEMCFPGRASVAVFSLVPIFEFSHSEFCWFKPTLWVEELQLSEPRGLCVSRQLLGCAGRAWERLQGDAGDHPDWPWI